MYIYIYTGQEEIHPLNQFEKKTSKKNPQPSHWKLGDVFLTSAKVGSKIATMNMNQDVFFFSQFPYFFPPKKTKNPKKLKQKRVGGDSSHFSHTGSPIDRLATEPLGAQPTPTYWTSPDQKRWTWKFQQSSHHNVCWFFCGRLIHRIFSMCTLAWA